MSFPKAKIHRFNEEMTCAPPPGKYDPKYDTKVKGVVIEKSKRFMEPKMSSASSAESIDSIGRSNSNLSVLPVFRTPQLKRSHLKTPKSVPANHFGAFGSAANVRRNLEIFQSPISNEAKTENNVLTKQLEDKSEAIRQLNEELINLQLTLSEEQVRITEERKIAERFHNEEIEGLNDDINALKLKLDNERETHIQELREVIKETDTKFETMQLADKDIIKSISEEFDNQQKEMEVDFRLKLNEICENMKTHIECITSKVEKTVNRVHELESDFSAKQTHFNRLIEETQNKLEGALKDLATMTTLRDKFQANNLEQKHTIEDSNNRIKDLEGQLGKLESELARSKQVYKTFHMTTLEHRKTIEALSKRLFESESEVERLNSVQSDLEGQKKLLEGKAENLIMEIINLRESMKYLESEIIKDVEEINHQLTAKVDSYRIKAAEETKSLLEAVEEKQQTINGLVKDIDYYQNREVETEAIVNNLNTKSEQYCNEITELKLKMAETEEEFAEKINVQKNIYSILDENYNEKCELVKQLQELKLEQDQLICELREKLDHQSECAQKASAQINCLVTENDTKSGQIEILVTQLESTGECVQTISKQVQNLVGQLSDKDKQINMLHQELEIKIAALISVTSENDTLKYRLEQKLQQIDELDKEARETHTDNEKYVDELISEIVLEKERSSELASVLSQLEDDKTKLEDDLKLAQTVNEETSFTCSNLKDELQKLHNDVNSEKEECLRLTQMLTEHENNRLSLEEKLEKDNIEKAQLILELSTKIDNLEDALKKTESMKVAYEIENEELKLKLDSAQEYIEDLVSTNESTKQKVEQLSNRIEEMSTDLLYQTEGKEKLQSEVDLNKFEEVVAGLKDEIVLLCDNIDAKEDKVIELSEVKDILEQQLANATEDYEKKIKDLKDLVSNGVEKNNELSTTYAKMEQRKNEYKVYSVQITEEVDQLKEDMKKIEADKLKLENEKKQLEIMVGPFMKQLRDYEEERNMLATKKGAVEEELYALERKYAQSLGHQNLKQKIHYVSRLKEENIQLKQTIDQLTSENLRIKSKCKDLENVSRENHSPKPAKKSINRVHSPNVLKDRNHQ